MDTIKFWHSYIAEFRALCGEEITADNLRQAFPWHLSDGFLDLNRAETENDPLPVTEMAGFILFMFEDRIRKAHQAHDQVGFEYLIRQPIHINQMVAAKLDIPYILLFAHKQVFSGILVYK